MAVAVSPYASKSDQQTAVNSLLFRGFVGTAKTPGVDPGSSLFPGVRRSIARWYLISATATFADYPTSERLKADSRTPTLSDLPTVFFHHMCRLTAGLESNHRTDDGTANRPESRFRRNRYWGVMHWLRHAGRRTKNSSDFRRRPRGPTKACLVVGRLGRHMTEFQ